MDELNFKLEVFEGPLDLLLKLIAKNKVNIYDIPIALIFDQYMEQLEIMQVTDMDMTGEFITMATELMLIKSRMLLPRLPDSPEEDPRARLAAALIEYKKIKEKSMLLAERYAQFAGRITKDPEIIEEEVVLGAHHVKQLQNAFRSIIRRNRESGELPVKSEKQIGSLLSYRTVSIASRIYKIMRHLYKNGDTSFSYFILSSGSRSEIVATFVAILELLSTQRIKINVENEPDYIFHLDREHSRK